MWKFGPGVVVFVVRPDREEIGIIVPSEIVVQLGIKGESERFVFFYFSKRCRTLELEGVCLNVAGRYSRVEVAGAGKCRW